MRKIITDFVFPPIPLPDFNWCAFYAGEEEGSARGWGSSEAAAIADLVKNYPDEDA